MKLTDTFKFGKYNGQTVEEVLETERGRSWIRWYCDQPCNNPKYAEADKKQKQSLLALIGGGTTKEIKGREQSREQAHLVDIYEKLVNIDNKMDIILSVLQPPITAKEPQEGTWNAEEE
jgi:hypothetical protein